MSRAPGGRRTLLAVRSAGHRDSHPRARGVRKRSPTRTPEVSGAGKFRVELLVRPRDRAAAVALLSQGAGRGEGSTDRAGRPERREVPRGATSTAWKLRGTRSGGHSRAESTNGGPTEGAEGSMDSRFRVELPGRWENFEAACCDAQSGAAGPLRRGLEALAGNASGSLEAAGRAVERPLACRSHRKCGLPAFHVEL